MKNTKKLDTVIGRIVYDLGRLAFSYSYAAEPLAYGVGLREYADADTSPPGSVSGILSFMSGFDKKIGRRIRPAIDGKITPNDITARLEVEIEHDISDLWDFYHWCRKRNHTYFRGMTIEQFKSWNEQRIDELDRQPPYETTDQARTRIETECGGRTRPVWNAELGRTVMPGEKID